MLMSRQIVALLGFTTFHLGCGNGGVSGGAALDALAARPGPTATARDGAARPASPASPTPPNGASPANNNGDGSGEDGSPNYKDAKLFGRVSIQTAVVDGKRVLKFPSGRVAFLANESLTTDYLKSLGFNESHIALVGSGATATILDFTAAVGVAIAVGGDGVRMDVNNLAIEGQWRGLRADNKPYRYTTSEWTRLWSGWNKAILVRADHGTVVKRPKVVVGPDVRISGFYYGITADEAADAEVTQVAVTDAGDAAYFAYYGGRLHITDSTAARSADLTRGLGHGYVAETLYYESSLDATKAYKIRSCRASALGAEPTTSPVAAAHACLENLARSVPDDYRSKIIASNVTSNLHLYAGFVANLGADIEAKASVAVNAIAKDEFGNPLMALNDVNLASPQPLAFGAYDAGSGYVSRYGSRIDASGSYAYNNLIGYLAWANAEINARASRAWNNSYFGYHATRQGRIDAVGSGSFGRFQKYGYGVSTTDGAIRVDGAKAGADVPAFCVPGVSPCQSLQGEALGSMTTTSSVRQAPLQLGVTGFFYVE